MALMFPPFHLQFQGNTAVSLGFNFIGATKSASGSLGTINVALLAIELMGIGLIGGVGFLLARNADQNDDQRLQ